MLLGREIGPVGGEDRRSGGVEPKGQRGERCCHGHLAQPVQQPVTLYIELTGNTAPINSVDLVARVQGYLDSIDYKDGSRVKKGDPLFGIERDQYQAQLDQAKATLATAEASRWIACAS